METINTDTKTDWVTTVREKQTISTETARNILADHGCLLSDYLYDYPSDQLICVDTLLAWLGY